MFGIKKNVTFATNNAFVIRAGVYCVQSGGRNRATPDTTNTTTKKESTTKWWGNINICNWHNR